jgi:hypothetical protein
VRDYVPAHRGEDVGDPERGEERRSFGCSEVADVDDLGDTREEGEVLVWVGTGCVWVGVEELLFLRLVGDGFRRFTL